MNINISQIETVLNSLALAEKNGTLEEMMAEYGDIMMGILTELIPAAMKTNSAYLGAIIRTVDANRTLIMTLVPVAMAIVKQLKQELTAAQQSVDEQQQAYEAHLSKVSIPAMEALIGKATLIMTDTMVDSSDQKSFADQDHGT